MQHLRRYTSQFFFSHACESWRLDVPIQVYVKQFKDNHVIRPEWEAVYHFHEASLNLSIDDVLRLITTDFQCHAASVVFHIKCFYYNAESSLVQRTLNKIAVAKLFALLNSIVVVGPIYLGTRMNSD
jgi:hypothetical protein